MDNVYCEEEKKDMLLFNSQEEANEYIKSHSGIGSIKHLLYYCLSCNGWHYRSYIIPNGDASRWNDRVLDRI